jgi:hypothetical protein
MAKELVKRFKQAVPFMKAQHFLNTKILTDTISNYWTVIIESEVESLSDIENVKGFTSQPEVREIMKDYMNLVKGGKREIFNIE